MLVTVFNQIKTTNIHLLWCATNLSFLFPSALIFQSNNCTWYHLVLKNICTQVSLVHSNQMQYSSHISSNIHFGIGYSQVLLGFYLYCIWDESWPFPPFNSPRLPIKCLSFHDLSFILSTIMHMDAELNHFQNKILKKWLQLLIYKTHASRVLIELMKVY